MIMTWQVYFHHVTTEIRIRYVLACLPTDCLNSLNYTSSLYSSSKCKLTKPPQNSKYSRYISSLSNSTSVLSITMNNYHIL